MLPPFAFSSLGVSEIAVFVMAARGDIAVINSPFPKMVTAPSGTNFLSLL